jgi:glutamine amidotransferase
MTYLVGILSTHPEWLPCLLHSEAASLRVESQAFPAGWGIGTYEQGEVLRRLTPLDRSGSIDFRRLAQDARSTVMVGHVRRVDSAAPSGAQNTHPFRFGDWLFAHRGAIDHARECRPQLLQNVPPFLERNIAGGTDSEILFHVVLAHLHAAGHLRSGDAGTDVTAEAVRRGIREVDEVVVSEGGEYPDFALVLTNGTLMVAACRNLPLHIALFDRLVDCRACTDADRRARCGIHRSDRTDLRAVMLVSGADRMPDRYERLPEESLLGIKPDATVESYPLRPSALGLSGF